MVYTCCVPFCRGNYPKTTKVQLFSFPKDEVLKKKWLSAINRKHFVPTNFSRVCAEHFLDSDLRKVAECIDPKTGLRITAPLCRFKLKDRAVPSLFQHYPKYMVAEKVLREAPEERRKRVDNENFRKALARSLKDEEEYKKNNNFCSLTELCGLLKQKNLPEPWSYIEKQNSLSFFILELTPAPCIKFSVTINDDLEVHAFHGSIKIFKLGEKKFPLKVSNFSAILDILELFQYSSESNKNNSQKNDQSLLKTLSDFIEKLTENYDGEKEFFLDFIKEQIKLGSVPKENRRYSPDMMVFSSILLTISPHAYKFIRSSESLILPHPRTVQRICSSLSISPQFDDSSFSHIKKKSEMLNPTDQTVTIMLDEIHINPFLDFKGGNIVGMAHNKEDIATTAHVLMLQSLLSSYKEVVKIIPVKTITAIELHGFVLNCILNLEKLGFSVIAVVSDNNSINRKAMQYFASPPQLSIVYEHPSRKGKPLFYIIDSVHIFKSIRNNWLNQKNNEQAFYFPNFENLDPNLLTASFLCLKKLYDVEKLNLAKYSYKLNLKALFPTNFERQNVKLVMDVFNPYIIQALFKAGKHHNILNSDTTATFIDIIYKWWCIVNVKTPYKGLRYKDEYQKPISKNNDTNFEFLSKFLDWLDFWQAQKCSTGSLTKETHLALTHTTYALIEMSRYCIEELNFQYFLPGKIQTDALEHRFGKYRSLSGSQYHVSVRQIYEAETKLRLQNFLPLTLKSSSYGNIKITDLNYHDLDETENYILTDYDINISESDFIGIEDLLPVLVFLAGYCSRAALNKLKCLSCSNLLLTNKEMAIGEKFDLIAGLDRGGLFYPQEEVIHIIVCSFIVLQKLISGENEKKFLENRSQRKTLCDLTLNYIELNELFLDGACPNHSTKLITTYLIRAAANSLLNNYCKKMNDLNKANAKCGLSKSKTKKRKLETVCPDLNKSNAKCDLSTSKSKKRKLETVCSI